MITQWRTTENRTREKVWHSVLIHMTLPMITGSGFSNILHNRNVVNGTVEDKLNQFMFTRHLSQTSINFSENYKIIICYLTH